MNEKVRALQKLFNLSDEWIRANKKLVSTLIKGGDTPGPGPEPPGPTPTVTIVFKPHNDETGFNVTAAAGTTNCTVDSTIEGINVPFTAALKTENDWCTLNIVNNVLQISVTKNLVEEVRSCAIVVTQQELLGEQKSFELAINQEAAEPVVFDFISNPNIMQFGNGDNIILDYIFNNAPNAEKKAISPGENPVQVLDPKCMKNYDVFGRHHSQFKDNPDLADASLLGYMPVAQIPGAAFNGCGKLHKVLIPETCTSIGDNAFRYCGSYEVEYHVYATLNLYFLGSVPPTFASSALSDAIIGRIYVPVGAKAAYEAALPGYTQYIEETNVKTTGSWNGNMSYKYNATLGYYTYVDPNIGFDEAMSYINS